MQCVFQLRYAVLLVMLCLAACRQSAQPTPTPEDAAANVTLTLSIQPDPPMIGDSTLTIAVTDSRLPIAGVEISVRGDMTHAGMRPVEGVGETDAAGVAKIPFAWSMGGDWIVTVTATLPEGTEVEKTFNLSIGA